MELWFINAVQSCLKLMLLFKKCASRRRIVNAFFCIVFGKEAVPIFFFQSRNPSV